MCKLCVFAGTGEGRELIDRLSGRGARITACVATEYGEAILGGHADVEVCHGRMDRAEMADFLRRGKFDAVIDATHPYAAQATENIASACREAGAPCMRLARASGATEADGVFVKDTAACAAYLKDTQGNILLTTGSKELPAFHDLAERLYARVLPMRSSLEACAACGIAPSRIIAMQGPFDEEMNLAMLRAVNARYLVTKDTGDAGGYAAKIAAARKLGATCVVIGRPTREAGLSMEEIVDALERRFSPGPVRKSVTLAGIGMGGDTRTLGLARAVREAECVIGARRMLESMDLRGKQTYAAVAAKDIADFIQRSDCRRFCALFSGDTGFYSGAKALSEALKGAEVEILPGVGSLPYLCSRLGRPWEDVRAVSLHSRDCDFAREVERHPAVFALLGGKRDARATLGRLDDAGLSDLRAYVGERLGYPEERIVAGSVRELRDRKFDALSVLLVENPRAGEYVAAHGLPDEAFERDNTPMTKSEVRSVALSKLRVSQGATVYDVGSGSGSVTVEAALLARHGRVYAVERSPRAVELTRRNVERFRLCNAEVIAGEAPEAFGELPPPTHAFIGGSGGRTEEIVEALLAKNAHVRIVATAVTLETIAELSRLAARFSESDIAEVCVAKPRALGAHRLMTAQNPVYIFTFQNAEDKR